MAIFVESVTLLAIFYFGEEGGRRRNTKAELSQNNVGFSRVAVAMQQPDTGDFERPVTSIPFSPSSPPTKR